MAESDRRKYTLRDALVIVGLIFLYCWPLEIFWPPWSATPNQKVYLALWYIIIPATVVVTSIIASQWDGEDVKTFTFEGLLVRGAVLYLRYSGKTIALSNTSILK